LHWVSDHHTVFKNFYELLLPNGQLLIQCGGYGNLENTISIFNTVKDSSEFKPYFSNWKEEWNFAKPVDTEKTLKEIAGKFNVSDMQIHRIKTGENWRHIKVPKK